jgi:copper(I)-binding protein
MKQLAASLLFALALGAVAQAPAPAPVTVQGAWARPAVPGQDSSGAYMTLTAREPLTLLGAQTPAANIVEIHEMKMVGDVMKMRAADTLPLEPGKPLRLARGGYHLILMHLKAPYTAGTTIAMRLQFRDAAGRTRTLPVKVPVAQAAPAHDRR